MRHKSISPKAFTLVELLVVIGIIAALLALLMPALSKARLAAINVRCLSNMKQVHAAVVMYTNDYKGWYPPNTYDHWQNAVGFGGGAPNGTWGDPAAGAQFNNNYDTSQIWAPQFDPYLNANRTVVVCAGIQFNADPSINLMNYTYYTGLGMTSGRVGSVRERDLQPASSTTATAPNALRIFLSCSNLFGYDPASLINVNHEEYWGFLNTWGNFGQVHGQTNPARETFFPTASRGGTKMNVLGLDGGVTVVNSSQFPATQ